MAHIPTLQRLRAGDFPDQKDWIGKLLLPVNSFFESVVGALSGNLTFEENITSQIYILDFRYDGADSFPLKFTSTLPKRPFGLFVVKAVENEDAPSAISSAVFCDWKFNQSGQIEITNITGLTTGKRYLITVIVV